MRGLIVVVMLFSCQQPMKENKESPYIVVLGIAQDAGFPQAGCNKECCKKAWLDPQIRKSVSCIALVDPVSKKQWLFDATPDIKFQLNMLENISNINPLSGVFLTHAHIGHYTGLMHFGKEVMDTKNLPVYAMDKMQSFIQNHAPWKQLTKINNIQLQKLADRSPVILNERIIVTPFLVPHRDEYSETVGYKISINDKSLVFIPDIDKWHDWQQDIKQLIKEIDYAFIDGTFYQDGELDRDMSQIPHPLVVETMDILSDLDKKNKKKVHFIHLNHTNPLLLKNSAEQKTVFQKGFNVAKEGQIITL